MEKFHDLRKRLTVVFIFTVFCLTVISGVPAYQQKANPIKTSQVKNAVKLLAPNQLLVDVRTP